MKTYSELIKIPTFEDRLKYLREYGSIGEDTFGFNRYLNQVFYRTNEWKQLRRSIILRDEGKDLGINPVPNGQLLIVHHLNPLTMTDLEQKTEFLLDPEFLITTTLKTHNIIHYGTGDFDNLHVVLERKPGDTCPWKKT